MAKLSARNRKELVRLSKETRHDDVAGDITWSKMTYAIMSDRTILVKRDVRFKADAFYGQPARFHSYGWKVWTKVKDLEGALERTIKRFTDRGYTREP